MSGGILCSYFATHLSVLNLSEAVLKAGLLGVDAVPSHSLGQDSAASRSRSTC